MPAATSSTSRSRISTCSARYGSDNEFVALDRLGGEAWQRRKARLKERIREIAHELLRTAAARALRQAPVLLPEQAAYDQFAERFPWEETEDQERAIEEVLADLAEGKPMDRLVCGDVGFGKTEVALRAAFVAAMAGQQVAVVAPTTLLARQHYSGFTERFSGFPLNVGRLSRLVPDKEASKTRAGLTDGTMDIVIGTHAILSKTVNFKRLGLVIVDEEQRFGVNHKERLKQLRADVHVLTLTATPIPRTLQMAMSRPARALDHPDPAGRPPRGAHLCDGMGRHGDARGAAARASSRRAELHRRAPHRRHARCRGMAAQDRARSEVRSPPTARWARARSRSG